MSVWTNLVALKWMVHEIMIHKWEMTIRLINQRSLRSQRKCQNRKNQSKHWRLTRWTIEKCREMFTSILCNVFSIKWNESKFLHCHRAYHFGARSVWSRWKCPVDCQLGEYGISQVNKNLYDSLETKQFISFLTSTETWCIASYFPITKQSRRRFW